MFSCISTKKTSLILNAIGCLATLTIYSMETDPQPRENICQKIKQHNPITITFTTNDTIVTNQSGIELPKHLLRFSSILNNHAQNNESIIIESTPRKSIEVIAKVLHMLNWAINTQQQGYCDSGKLYFVPDESIQHTPIMKSVTPELNKIFQPVTIHSLLTIANAADRLDMEWLSVYCIMRYCGEKDPNVELSQIPLLDVLNDTNSTKEDILHILADNKSEASQIATDICNKINNITACKQGLRLHYLNAQYPYSIRDYISLASKPQSKEGVIFLPTDGKFTNGNRFEFTSLDGVEHLENYDTLVCNNSKLTDLSPLSNLTVCELSLNDNFITSIDILTLCKKLTYLDITRNLIGPKVPPLPTCLKYLKIINNFITDISNIASLTNLVELNLAENSISDISSLSTCTNLTALYLHGNDIKDFSVLALLTKLTDLTISNNNTTTLPPLPHLRQDAICYYNMNLDDVETE